MLLDRHTRSQTISGTVLALLGVLVVSITRADEVEAFAPDSPIATTIDERVQDVLQPLGDGLMVSIWVGPARGAPWFVMDPEVPLPSASAIKTAYLVALFARFADDLDATPPGLDEALSDHHPAMAPYTPEQRDDIRTALQGASVRTLGGVMMGSIDAPNHVYNAAASTITAILGGPDGLTAAIHAIDPAFQGIVARRYMLAPRNVTGDNEASAAAIAAVLARLAVGELPDVSPETLAAMRDAVIVQEDLHGLQGRHFVKGGSLNSDPITRIKSGWWERPELGPVVFTVMLARPNPGNQGRAEAAEQLETAASTLSAMLLEAIRDESNRPRP